MSITIQMSEAAMTIRALSEEFPQHVIQIKPGSKPGAAQYKPATPYVSHGSVTKRLNDVCPGWSSRVVEWHTYMDPAGKLQCAGVTLEVTMPNAGSHQEFGKAATPRNFGDDAKNAMSDALKRCAMRFGVALDLWESADEHDEDSPYEANPKDGGYEGGLRQPAPPRQQPQRPRPEPLNAAPPGSPYDADERERLARQIRRNDEALSPAEYQRHHELEAMAKVQPRPTPASNGTPAPAANGARPTDHPAIDVDAINPHPEGSVEHLLFEARRLALAGESVPEVWRFLTSRQRALGDDWKEVVREWNHIIKPMIAAAAPSAPPPSH